MHRWHFCYEMLMNFPTNMDTEVENVIREGKAEVHLLSNKNVFYNPVQEFNRDLR